MKSSKKLKKLLNNHLLLKRLAFGSLITLSIGAAFFLYDNPTIFSGLLLFFSVYQIVQVYFDNKIYIASQGLKVSDAMIPDSALIKLKHSTDIARAIEVIGKSYQQAFPVYFNDNFLGIINRDRFISAFGVKTNYDYVADFVEKKFEFIYGDESLEKLLSNGMLKRAGNMVVLDRDNKFQGLLSYEKLVEYILIDRVFKQSKNSELQDEFWL